MTPKRFEKFVRLTKVDEAERLVHGIAVVEELDKSGEIFDYESSKPLFEDWSQAIEKASGGKSLGNVREMHKAIAAGKLVSLAFDDAQKCIRVCAKILDDSTWEKVVEGVLTGFSIGGSYAKRWVDALTKAVRYTGKPDEISVVDNPCVGGALFEMVKADGVTEQRAFARTEASMGDENKDAAAAEPQGVTIEKVFEHLDAMMLPADQRYVIKSVLSMPEDNALAKGGVEIIQQANTAISALKQLAIEILKMPGEPDTWTLDDVLRAIRGAVSGKVLGECSVTPEEGEMAGAGAENPGADVPDAGVQKTTPAGALSKGAEPPAPVVPAEEWTPEQLAAFHKYIESTTVESPLVKLVNASLAKALEAHETTVLAKVDAKVGEAVTKVEGATAELRKSFDGIDTRVKAIEALPAPVGEPVSKTIGSGATGAADTPDLDAISAKVSELFQKGVLPPEAHTELRKELATAAMLQQR